MKKEAFFILCALMYSKLLQCFSSSLLWL